MMKIFSKRNTPAQTCIRAASTIAVLFLIVCLSNTINVDAAQECSDHDHSDGLGVNISNLSFSELKKPDLVSTLRQSGVGWIRISIYWGYVERTPGKFEWTAIDHGIDTLHANHIKALITLTGPVPCWALSQRSAAPCNTPQMTAPPPDLWAAFVKAVVQRYKGKIDSWEIWNEPNLVEALDDKDLYQRLAHYRDDILIPGAAAVHGADPFAKVVAPTFAAGTGGAETPDKLGHLLSFVFTPAARRDVNAISFHVYAPEDLIAYAKAARVSLSQMAMSDMSLWLTETGALVDPLQGTPPGRVGQRNFLLHNLADAFASNLYDKIFWFALTDSHNETGEPLDSYGLVNDSWEPRASFLIYRQFAQSNVKSGRRSGKCGE